MAVLTRQMDTGVRLPEAWGKLLLTVHVLTTVGLFGADLIVVEVSSGLDEGTSLSRLGAAG